MRQSAPINYNYRMKNIFRYKDGDNMAVKGIKVIRSGGINLYQCSSTDDESTYPTANECKAGSIMNVINESSKTVSDKLYFDGNVWASINPAQP